ncbi:hypothetical protein M5X00_26435 [Paenibacillus alvei]|uniref:hypothetical protein n=1 Tax=Paenibacillus alvei TaxID=44250 RepID=UPI0021D2A910|nr:hypothetical protein [Paenibacillus alvei]MCY9544889.1 hypothetical protein [Paenibacillus alvei]MCY9707790.1 hypothetical protein [Paenibacillus alvei]MCY9757771.1 hypothetical protein [Paenibacillus alvei]MEC0082698.1 hypothetical protein [Paenibacillus alvei]
MAKILIFEGAGWDVAEHNGVGNCRIRTRIKNIDGVSIYLEMSGTKKKKSKYSKFFVFNAYVNHCHEEGKDNESEFRRFQYGSYGSFEYTQEAILKFVNENLNCDFEVMKVVNDGSIRVHSTKENLC